MIIFGSLFTVPRRSSCNRIGGRAFIHERPVGAGACPRDCRSSRILRTYEVGTIAPREHPLTSARGRTMAVSTCRTTKGGRTDDETPSRLYWPGDHQSPRRHARCILRRLDRRSVCDLQLDLPPGRPSSLDIVEVVSCSMRELKVRVPRSELAKLRDIGGLVDLLHSSVAGGQAHV
jgi:hypothetical protein